MSRQGGIQNAITINEGDALIEAKLTNGENADMICGTSGRAICFNQQDVRSMGRNAAGVRGIQVPTTGWIW